MLLVSSRPMPRSSEIKDETLRTAKSEPERERRVRQGAGQHNETTPQRGGGRADRRGLVPAAGAESG